MPRGPRPARIAIVASRFNESVTTRLLLGARACLEERGVPGSLVEVHWVAGAWELPVMARALMLRGGYRALAALGAVIRGETFHFEVLATEAARGLMALQTEHGIPIGFGVLTCDTMDQALARSGGDAGNKGYDAMAAALEVAERLSERDAGPR